MLEELEIYAKEHNIPIMEKEGIMFLCNYIKDNNIKSILEIGSAIGYSSIMMALVDKDIRIQTIERDINRYNEAIKNIDKFNLNDQIKILNVDALDFELTETFDLIFIDAAKSQSIKFFDKFKHNLNQVGVIITDNLSFHGLVENPVNLSKNVSGLVRKTKEYIEFLENNQEYTTTFVNVGDKISISKKSN